MSPLLFFGMFQPRIPGIFRSRREVFSRALPLFSEGCARRWRNGGFLFRVGAYGEAGLRGGCFGERFLRAGVFSKQGFFPGRGLERTAPGGDGVRREAGRQRRFKARPVVSGFGPGGASRSNPWRRRGRGAGPWGRFWRGLRRRPPRRCPSRIHRGFARCRALRSRAAGRWPTSARRSR